jgi:integrase
MTEKRKGGRRSTGTVVRTKRGLFQAVITLTDGRRKRLPPFPVGTSEAMARERAAHYAEEVLRRGARNLNASTAAGVVKEDAPIAKWIIAWEADRLARGQTSTRENLSHYRLHILPSIGPKHVKDWVREDIRKLSRELDTKVRAKQISWKMAQNIWGTATRMCSDAAESKIDAIRCRADNPAAGVRGPDRGDEKAKEFLYPSEFLAFAAAGDVPMLWRRLVAIAVYTYLRAGELRVLEWADVDLEHGVIRVHRARNRVTGEVKATKGRRARPVPIELALRPLLATMHKEAGGKGLVLPDMPSNRDMARGLRRWLKRAKVLRAGLHTSNETQRSIVFHDLRGTGCTWMAVRGDDALKIQQRAGHVDFNTTQGYIRIAESVREAFGEPFPALPSSVLESNRSPESLHPSATIRNSSSFSGADGTRTRGLRRDRPAL